MKKHLFLFLTSLFFISPAFAQSGEFSPDSVRFSTTTPRNTLYSFFGFMQQDSTKKDSAAFTFYLKNRGGANARELASKLFAYIDAQGYFIDYYDAPDTSDYMDPESGKEIYRPFPEEEKLYLVKRGGEWLWSRATIKATPGLYGEVFPPDEFGDGEFHQFSLKSPYHTIISHIYFLLHEKPDQYHPDSSAMTLYHPNPEGEEAQELALKLLQFYDGQGYYIEPDYLPDDPNYMDTLTGKHIYHPIPEVPEIYVIKVGKKWVFSQKTVRAIPKLHRETYPLGTLDWIPDWGHKKALFLEIWQWMGIVLLILLTFIAHKLFTIVFRLVLNNIIKRFIKESIARNFFEKVARPLSLLVISLLLVKAIPILQLPIGVNRWLMLTLRVLNPIFVVMIFYFLMDMIAAFMKRQAEKSEGTHDDQLVPVVRKVLKAVVVILGAVFILSRIGVNVTALLAGLSIGGLALALASQDTVKNFLGSLMIFLDRPFQVGDWIIADGVEGTVEEVSIRSTRIRTFANSLISVPNAHLADTAVNNMGLRIYRRFFIKIGVMYGTPPHLIETFVEGMKELVELHPYTRKDYYEIHFNDMSSSSLDILFYTFFEVDSWTKELQGRHDLLIGIMELADDLGIGFAFPTQTIHLETMPGQKALSPVYNQNKGEADRLTKDYLDRFKKEVDARMNERKDQPNRFAGSADG